MSFYLNKVNKLFYIFDDYCKVPIIVNLIIPIYFYCTMYRVNPGGGALHTQCEEALTVLLTELFKGTQQISYE